MYYPKAVNDGGLAWHGWDSAITAMGSGGRLESLNVLFAYYGTLDGDVLEKSSAKSVAFW